MNDNPIKVGGIFELGNPVLRVTPDYSGRVVAILGNANGELIEVAALLDMIRAVVREELDQEARPSAGEATP